MASGDYVNKGTVIDIGLQGFTYTYVLTRDCTFEDTAEIRESIGEQGAPVQKTLVNPGRRIRLSGVVKTTNTDEVLAIKKGDVVSIGAAGAVLAYVSTAVKYMVEDRSVKLSPAGEVMLDMTLVREDSMASVYDA